MCEYQKRDYLLTPSIVFLKLVFISFSVMNMVFTISRSNNIDVSAGVNRGKVWKQWMFIFIAYLPFFTHGLQTTYLDSLPDDDIPRTTNNVPWTTTAYILGAIIGAPIFCWIADKNGRLAAVFAVATLQIISWILQMSGSTPDNQIAIKTILGISSSGIYTILPVYVKEISNNDSMRGVGLAMMMLMMSAGGLAMKLLVMSVEVVSVGYFVMALVVAQLLFMFVLVESPSYFAMKDQIEAAKTSLAKLKCMDAESSYLIKEITRLKDESDRAKTNSRLTLFHIIKNRIWRDAAKVGFVLHTVNMLGGSLVYLDHRKVLQISQSTVDETISNLAAPGILVAGGLTAMVFLKIWEQKNLLTISYAIMGLFLGLLGVYMQHDLVVSSNESWVPLTALAVVTAGYAVAWGLPFVVMVEILNLEIRAKLIGALYTYSQVVFLLHVHAYKYLEDYVGIYTLCYFYAMMNIFGAVYAIFGVPETRDKSVKQIEKSLKRVPLWLL